MKSIKIVNLYEFSVAIYTQTNSHSLIQSDHPVHVCDIEMGTYVQPLEESTCS